MIKESRSPIAGRPPRDPRLEPYLQNAAMWGAIKYGVVGVRYAGDEPSPRPMPKVSLYEHKRNLAASTGSAHGPVPGALHFAFYEERSGASPEKAILLPPEHLWWMALPQDSVLLSDGISHHYTEVFLVDRGQDRIYFRDPWPEDFFLRAGLNRLGIEARADPSLSISKAEFFRVVAGLVTWDTLRLVHHYFDIFRERRMNPDALLRFGFAVMDAEEDRMAPAAALLFGQALALIHAGDACPPVGDEVRDLAARQAYLAALCGGYFARTRGDGAGLAQMNSVLRLAVQLYGWEALEAGLSPIELCRLGNAALHAGDLQAALRVLDHAAAVEPDFEDPYWLRAATREKMSDAAGAATDAERAIARNGVTLSRLEAERAAIDPRAEAGLRLNGMAIEGRRGRRALELEILIRSRLALGNVEGAREVARDLAGIRPERASRFGALLADGPKAWR